MTEDEMSRIADLVVEKMAQRMAGTGPKSQELRPSYPNAIPNNPHLIPTHPAPPPNEYFPRIGPLGPVVCGSAVGISQAQTLAGATNSLWNGPVNADGTPAPIGTAQARSGSIS